ncbi:MAG: ATP-dependent DNA ligase [Candidatus Heimdallarchaeota archaeon]|nr:MAG: ATP-dependent DNA ligase [Candidatus Heimdallarchaeota archaeon]
MRFLDFCQVMERVDSTTKKNEKIIIVASFLAELSLEELPLACYYAAAQVFSKKSQLKVQFGWSSFMAVIRQLTTRSDKELQSFYRRKADFGSLIEWALLKPKPRPKSLSTFFEGETEPDPPSIGEINTFFEKIASLTGKGSLRKKKEELLQLLTTLSPLEAKYIARIITSDTRTGFQEGLLLEAIAIAFKRRKEHVRYAYMVLSDLGELALVSKNPSLNLTSIVPKLFHPLKSMLATKTDSIEDALDTFSPLVCESKIDGFRAQLHINLQLCKIYSRNLEDVTEAFPEITGSITPAQKKQIAPCILDGEIVGLVENKPVFFQDISTRILRKTDVASSVLKLPCYFFVFDVLLFRGESLLRMELQERKGVLSTLPTSKHVQIISSETVEDLVEIQDRFREAIKDGYEGLMLKDPTSLYLAGRRGKSWLKLKATLPTLDLVIVGAEWGHGRRTGWLSNYHLAAKENDGFQMIGKTFKGLTDSEFDWLTEKLKSLKITDESYGVRVQPQVVVEVEFDNIQQSLKYPSGMALRFARIKKIRTDKSIEDVDSIETVQQLYQGQLQRQKHINKS